MIDLHTRMAAVHPSFQAWFQEGGIAEGVQSFKVSRVLLVSGSTFHACGKVNSKPFCIEVIPGQPLVWLNEK